MTRLNGQESDKDKIITFTAMLPEDILKGMNELSSRKGMSLDSVLKLACIEYIDANSEYIDVIPISELQTVVRQEIEVVFREFFSRSLFNNPYPFNNQNAENLRIQDNIQSSGNTPEVQP